MKSVYSVLKSKLYYFKLRFVVFFDFVAYVRRCRRLIPLRLASGECWRRHNKRWSRLNIWVNRNWLDWHFSVSGKENSDYVPEDIYHAIIEPIMNDFRVALAYTDKNQFDRIWGYGLFPLRLYCNMHGLVLDGQYREVTGPLESCLSGEKVVVKPALESGDGRGIDVFTRSADGIYRNREGDGLSQEHLARYYGKDFLVQAYVAQHPFYAQFNPTSLNTVRLLTYRSVVTEEVVNLGGVLRVGKMGAAVDSMSGGGFAYEVFSDGALAPYGIDDFGHKMYEIGEVSASQVGRLYHYDEMIRVVLEVARQMPYFRLLGFDVCVDANDRIWLIEINTRFLGISIHQNHGASLFGKYTDEVVAYCAGYLKQKSIVYSSS